MLTVIINRTNGYNITDNNAVTHPYPEYSFHITGIFPWAINPLKITLNMIARDN